MTWDDFELDINLVSFFLPWNEFVWESCLSVYVVRYFLVLFNSICNIQPRTATILYSFI